MFGTRLRLTLSRLRTSSSLRTNLASSSRYSQLCRALISVTDDVEIPRAHRPRNGLLLNSSSIALPTRESLRDFLHPLPDIWDPSPREKNSLSRPTAPSTSASLLGQPPTESGQDDDLDPSVRSGPQTELRETDIDLDLAIESIYASVRGLEPESVILNAKNAETGSDSLHLEGKSIFLFQLPFVQRLS